MPWKKGQSGNPRGPRPRIETGDRLEYTKLLRRATPKAITRLEQEVESGDDGVQAARVILSYSLGRPPETPFAITEVPDDVFWHEAKRRHEQDERARAAKDAEGPLSS